MSFIQRKRTLKVEPELRKNEIHEYKCNRRNYRVAQKFGTIILYALTLPNINRFSKLFHYQNHEEICNNTITKDPTTPQVCRYTTLWNVNVLKATIENKTTSVTIHFKKLTTGNNVFIVSVIV